MANLSEDQRDQLSNTETHTTADRRVLALASSFDVTPDVLATVAAILDPTNEALKKAMELNHVETIPEGHVGFAEAADLLLDHGIILGKELEGAVFDAERRGYIDYLVHEGTIKDKNEYEELFKKVTFNKSDLEKMASIDGSQIEVVFSPGLLNLKQEFAALFVNAKIPTIQGRCSAHDRYVPIDLDKAKSIIPDDVPQLHDLCNKGNSIISQFSSSFTAAYKEGKSIEPSGPKISFIDNSILDDNNAKDLTGTQSEKMRMDEYMIHIQAGDRESIDLATYMQLVRNFIDLGLADLADEKGYGLHLMNCPDYREFLKECFENRSIDNHIKFLKFGNLYNLINPSGQGVTLRLDAYCQGPDDISINCNLANNKSRYIPSLVETGTVS